MAVHDWDIRSPFEPSHNFSESTLLALIERIPNNRRPWTIPFGTTYSAPKCYRFDLDGITDRLDIIIEGDKARMETSGDAPVDLTLAGHADAFVLLMYGRLSLDSSITRGIFKATGTLDLIPAFDDWLESH